MAREMLDFVIIKNTPSAACRAQQLLRKYYISNMKLAVLGATGQSGQCLLKQALDANHEVTAIVRNPGKLGEIQHERLRVSSCFVQAWTYVHGSSKTRPQYIGLRREGLLCASGVGGRTGGRRSSDSRRAEQADARSRRARVNSSRCLE